MTVSFKNRVVLVTGAASGLGRACALATAARGAQLVLVDRADCTAIAAEVGALGALPVVLQCDLADPTASSAAVNAAIARYGRIDSVIAAAGMLRDRSFAKMDFEEEFRPVLRVHLEATAQLAHAAWPHMRAAGYGRLLFFGSHAGLFGNFGQANYSAAKMGVVGLARTLALEGAHYGIHVNAIAPLAATPMAQGTAIADEAKLLRPASVAATAAWLCSESCPANGAVLAVAGGAVAGISIVQATPTIIAADQDATAEDVERLWPMIATAASHEAPPDAVSGVARMIAAINAAASKAEPEL
jgi:NAD(P)-dependent dehydrogenase (short-subunit alcohol dehydrogenase family)